MPLTLTIRNVTALENGSPVALVLDRRGAIIGRASSTDWALPDPALHISSRHCEVRYNADRYELIDISTNGTFMLGQAARLPGPHVISQGDVFVIGNYEIEASLDEAAAAAAVQRNAGPPTPEWQGWAAAAGQNEAAPMPPSSEWGSDPLAGTAGGSSSDWGPAAAPQPSGTGSGSGSGWGGEPEAPPPPPASGGWAAETPAAPPSGPTDTAGWGAPPPSVNAPGWGAQAGAPAGQGWSATPKGQGQEWVPETPPAGSANWVPPAAAPPPPMASPWNVAPKAEATPASPWSSPVSAAPPKQGPADVWGKFAASNVVDWARGGFGQQQPAITPPPSASHSASVASAQFTPPSMSVPEAPQQPGMAQPPAPAAPPPPQPAAAPSQPVSAAPGGLEILAAAAGLDRERLSQADPAALEAAGGLLRQLVSGLVVLLEARARAKSQMGAQATSLEFAGNNPLKFARTPEQALTQLLNPPERGFMPSDRAIEDAFKDLQAHQMATLMAMQGALRATLEMFSPKAIRSRADNKGMLAKILPTARDAELWKAYEREFSGVAHDSDEAFMDMFAKEFRRAYNEVARKV